jgi:cystathionine beta-lyase
MSDATRLLHTGQAGDPLLRTVGPPIQKGSTVLSPDAASLYDAPITYGREGLATHQALVAGLAALEHAAKVKLFPSGLAAMAGTLSAILGAGDEVLVSDAVYKPTRRFCDRVLRRFGVATIYYPPRATPSKIDALITPRTKLIVMESPGSLSLEMLDVPAIAAMARSRGVLTLIDNTWSAGLYFRPLDHGVDLSVQALTKYVGGHSDVFMGSAATNNLDVARALDAGVLDFGWAVSPEDAYMMLRGLRTLPTRLARHDASARRVASWLAGHPAVAQVTHPALPASPDHAIWSRDYAGAGGLFAFSLRTGAAPAVDTVLDALSLFGLGFSWGGYESLALDCEPQFSSRRARPDCGGPLIRLSIGLEDPEDLIADLEQALGRAR